MRLLGLIVVLSLGLVMARATPAGACVRAPEANTLIGWSSDGAYALLALVDDKGVWDHAEILPTRYQGFVYVIATDDDQVVVTKVKVGQCADFGDEPDAVIERKRGALTEALVRNLKTVAAMKIVNDSTEATKATATFTGAKRYAAHDLELSDGDKVTTYPVPVWCVGSCMADEHWKDWKATVVATHTAPSGEVLYEVHLSKVCNAGRLIRLIASTPAKKKAPRRRCTGSGG